MTTSQTIPQQQDGTRDVGVSTEPRDFVRPPYAVVLDALRALEISYGTANLAKAMRALRGDRGFAAREVAGNLASVRDALVGIDPNVRHELERDFANAVRNHRPYPGTKVA